MPTHHPKFAKEPIHPTNTGKNKKSKKKLHNQKNVFTFAD
jgi:hypothetical protein